MRSVVQLHPQSGAPALARLAEGRAPADRARLGAALEFAEPLYAGQVLPAGEQTWVHALGLTANLAAIGVDAVGRMGGLLFAAPKHVEPEKLAAAFGAEVASLAAGVEKLYQLRIATRANPTEQNEVLRKMVLGMVEDVRVVLIRLASRTQTLRWFARNPTEERALYARESLDIYAPLANRLGVAQLKWEIDDYISRPKGNLYQSLHTAVLGPEGKTLEVQIRTEEMHRHAEFGVASHWRYKEKVKTSEAFEQKIAWLRELLAWRDEVADWASTAKKKAQLDDTVYVLTPQGKVLDLPAGSTPIDFAYALHSDLGHRCRGARVDGQIVPLDTPLASEQRVQIVTAKSGGA